jgi:NAD+ diphosphatase
LLLPSHFVPLWSPPTSAGSGGFWFLFQAGKLLVAAQPEGGATIPKAANATELPLPITDAYCIGAWHGELCWAALADPVVEPLPNGFLLAGLRSLFGRLPDAWLAVAGRACQVVEFHRTHRFCGACASATLLHDESRARRCPGCGESAYPRISPAMMVLIKRDTAAGRELLLARGARFPGAFYSALAGFVEPSESVEDCLHRETLEEVGIRVRNLRYYGSQGWPFPHSLMIAFVADYESGEIACQPSEIVDAQWFTLDRLPLLPQPVSIARRLINHAIAEVAPTHPVLDSRSTGGLKCSD